ncbi:helix-turn-helix domain-containing protein [Pseudokineococcus basanitobsidens]|uniref:Helix-turn-helix domain-containing protein n=1 Tax=Pseudokineococcus basanitobsidens TaxID=1926649 RepID=A0ABU8RF68_9ACTN
MAVVADARARSPRGDGVLVSAPALWTHVGDPLPMPRPHRHDDVEVNVVVHGRLRYVFGGAEVEVDAGHAALFWGGTPHQLVAGTTPGAMGWVHVPLATALAWGLRVDDVGALLQPRPVVVRLDDLGPDVGPRVTAWHEEVLAGEPDAALLEVQALVLRLLRCHRTRAPRSGASARTPAAAPGHVDAVVAMTRYIADHFREPVTTADVARAAHLAPTYAMTLFRRGVGCTIGAYLVRCRVAEARRLLLGTSRPTTDVAAASGFGSLSQFYEHFTHACGVPPARYRAAAGTHDGDA